MSSNDKTADLLVATTRATKDGSSDAGATASEEKKVTASAPAKSKTPAKKAAAKKAPAKKAVSKKAAPKKKAPAKKAPARKSENAAQKEKLLDTIAFGRRVWPD